MTQLAHWHFFHEDMDGNGVISPETEIKEGNHYYPFGLKHKGYNNVISGRDHNYGYNGIEKSNELGNNMLEMDIRQYDPAIARWIVQDPITHHDFSPYQAFDNNPIFWADPSGADAVDFAKDLFNRSDSGTTWTNNNDGTFSDGNGNNVNASDNSEGNTDSSEEDCCPWLDRKIDQQLVMKEAIKNGKDPRKAWQEFKDLTGDTEIGEATKTAIIEVGFFFVGEWVFVKVFQGGVWVYRTYKASRAAKATMSSSKFLKLLKPIDEFDEGVTLFRGSTGSEAGSASIFLTDNAAVAATYIKNGGQVFSYRVSEYSLKFLEQAGNLNKLRGIHKATGVINNEYQFVENELIKALNMLANPL